MRPLAAFLADLDTAKIAAEQAETAFRAEAAARTQALATARTHAYRRADLMAGLARMTADAETRELAAGAGQALLRARLGWDTDSAARDEVLSRFSAVALAFHAASGTPPQPGTPPADAPDPADALQDFESWYLATRETPFWLLFDHHLPETPVIDF